MVPKSLQDQVMRHMYGSLLSGHLGRKKTREKILQRYYWHGVCTRTNIWVAKCDSCEAIKPPSKVARSPMGTMPVGAPIDRLHWFSTRFSGKWCRYEYFSGVDFSELRHARFRCRYFSVSSHEKISQNVTYGIVYLIYISSYHKYM